MSKFQLTPTTQGPLYPPSEIVDKNGDFVVVGNIIREDKAISWGMAIVSKNSTVPKFGEISAYSVKEELNDISEEKLSEIELFTLPLPLPLNNYPMVFAPEQCANAAQIHRPSLPLNKGYIYDYRESDGRRKLPKIVLSDWLKAEGSVDINTDGFSARFDFSFKNLVPNSLYTVMSLREKDLDPNELTRPGPLGIPNVFITDEKGNGNYFAILDNPFPKHDENSNRIINIIVLFMSSQQSYGGAIGYFGLGGDVHAQLKLSQNDLLNSLLTKPLQEK